MMAVSVVELILSLLFLIAIIAGISLLASGGERKPSMKKETYICDRCGAEISGSVPKVISVLTVPHAYTFYDLCDTCADKFNLFVENKLDDCTTCIINHEEEKIK